MGINEYDKLIQKLEKISIAHNNVITYKQIIRIAKQYGVKSESIEDILHLKGVEVVESFNDGEESQSTSGSQYELRHTSEGVIDQVYVGRHISDSGLYATRTQDVVIGDVNNVQAFIVNLTFPSTLEEVEYFKENDGKYNLEQVLEGDYGGWTAPRWAKVGDIMFITHAKTAGQKISALKTQLKNLEGHISEKKFNQYKKWLEEGKELFDKYNGRIVAVAKVIGMPEAEDTSEEIDLHWKSRLYAEIDVFYSFENPVHVDECRDYFEINKTGAITPIFGDAFDKLKEKIMENNSVPNYLEEAIATPLPLTKINTENWMNISEEYRRSFMFEAQFRHYYVDYLLKTMSDRKKIYSECRCIKEGINPSFIDNVIYFGNLYLPVEVKLNINAERDIKSQVRKYCYDDIIYLDKKGKSVNIEQVYANNVVIIDTEKMYLFDYDYDTIDELCELKDMKTMEDLYRVKNILIDRLES